MTEDPVEYLILGTGKVQNDQRRISFPEIVYELQILLHQSDLPDDPDEEAVGFAHWAYDRKTGWPFIADRPLSDIKLSSGEGEIPSDGREVRYKNPQRRKEHVSPQSENYLTIPKPFFFLEDKTSKDGGVPEPAIFKHDEVRHFVSTRMALSNEPNEVKSMYVLNDSQMEMIMNNTVDLTSGDDIPQFM